MRTRSLRWFPWFVPALVVVAAPGRASAQEASPAEHEQAVTQFQAGRRFVEQKDCKNAIPRFLESLKHEENVGARFNLAGCSKEEGRIVEAWNQYKGAEQLAIKKNDAERRTQAHDAAAAIEPTVLKLRLVLPKNIPEFTVKIDNHAVDKPDYQLLETGYAVEPGKPHTVEVTATNRMPWTKSGVQGPAGAELPAMVVDLGAPLEAEGADVGNGQRTAGLVVGGVGVAGLAVGAIFGFVAKGKKSAYDTEVKNDCGGDPQHCDPSHAAAINDKKDAISGPATISTIGFIAGGALLIGGAVLYFTAPKGTTPATTGRLRLLPAVGPGTAGAMLGGTF